MNNPFLCHAPWTKLQLRTNSKAGREDQCLSFSVLCSDSWDISIPKKQQKGVTQLCSKEKLFFSDELDQKFWVFMNQTQSET